MLKDTIFVHARVYYSRNRTMTKEILAGKTLDELMDIISGYALPRYTAREMALWIYQRGALDIHSFTNLSKQARERLSNEFEVGIIPAVKMIQSADGTKKYLFTTPRKHYFETALIPDRGRKTLCISVQSGCKFGCAFCMTGQQGLQGNLTAAQILNQILAIPERKELTNLVFMGMGEPFDNTEAVLKALSIITADHGLHFNPKKITVSTVGLIPGMTRFLAESQCHLAVSLHSPFAEERAQLMPVERKYPIRKVIQELKSHALEKQRRISFEYILFRGMNDSLHHVKELARLLNGLKCRINLMHFHKIPDSSLIGCSTDELIHFRNSLNQKGIIATIRESRGEDILAACGLLSTKEINKK